MLNAEVLVIGAGPAGAAAALNLAPTRNVIVADWQPPAPPCIGESVPPAIRRLLADMGLLESFLNEGHAPCYGNRSIWGSASPTETDFLRDPDGHGWHLDRTRFGNWLREAARARGASILRAAQVRKVERRGESWQVMLSTPDGPQAVAVNLLIDAGGRSAPLARQVGAVRRVLDRLVCGWVHGRTDRGGRGAGFTYVEAVEDGWWYTAPLPRGRRVLAFHTDADLLAACIARTRGSLLANVNQYPELTAVLSESGFVAEGQSGFTAAHSAVLEPCAGPGWMAIGDAALSLDPLSAQGLLNALFTGLASAEAADRFLSKCDVTLEEYARTVRGIREAYGSHLASWYKAEVRWPNSEFWRRRQSHHGLWSGREERSLRPGKPRVAISTEPLGGSFSGALRS